jgi:hypothetical protein
MGEGQGTGPESNSVGRISGARWGSGGMKQTLNAFPTGPSNPKLTNSEQTTSISLC